MESPPIVLCVQQGNNVWLGGEIGGKEAQQATDPVGGIGGHMHGYLSAIRNNEDNDNHQGNGEGSQRFLESQTSLSTHPLYG